MDLICVFCLEIDIKDNLIEYNHCGIYNIHFKCLNKWKINECFICREQIINEITNVVEDSNNDENLEQYRTRNMLKKCLNFFGIH